MYVIIDTLVHGGAQRRRGVKKFLWKWTGEGGKGGKNEKRKVTLVHVF
jgi:hypothetical protein